MDPRVEWKLHPGGGAAEREWYPATELNLGRSAMLGFAATTYLDVSTNGLGPIEQLIGEEKSLVTHVVNPLNLARDVLEVTGLYVESIILVWVFLSGVFFTRRHERVEETVDVDDERNVASERREQSRRDGRYREVRLERTSERE